jgi:hypothetical protein
LGRGITTTAQVRQVNCSRPCPQVAFTTPDHSRKRFTIPSWISILLPAVQLSCVTKSSVTCEAGMRSITLIHTLNRLNTTQSLHFKKIKRYSSDRAGTKSSPSGEWVGVQRLYFPGKRKTMGLKKKYPSKVDTKSKKKCLKTRVGLSEHNY